MFINIYERIGTKYFEFQFCKNKKLIGFNKVKENIIEPYQKDSLLISDDDFNNFFEIYGRIFECALFPNGKKGFYPYGINYYDKKCTENILNELKDTIDDKYLCLINWLEIAAEKYNGFYILGL